MPGTVPTRASRIPILQVDAFTDAPFRGNPAAVCITAGPLDAEWMQNVAAEMNLSETAFLHPQDGGYALRWFTPAIEVALCGHATLASAHVLWQKGYVQPGELARFHTQSGMLTAEQAGDWIELNFPATREEPADPPGNLLEALAVQPVYVGRNKFDYLVEVESEEVLRAMRPDHGLLRQLPVRGVIVTSRGREYDFVSRFFAPGSGVDEDPVTGSAHCALTPYWAPRLGKTEMRAFQASRRGGEVRVRLDGDRVRLIGQAVTVLEGELLA
jgi:PhzF family phenazine biosynthesis protein